MNVVSRRAIGIAALKRLDMEKVACNREACGGRCARCHVKARVPARVARAGLGANLGKHFVAETELRNTLPVGGHCPARKLYRSWRRFRSFFNPGLVFRRREPKHGLRENGAAVFEQSADVVAVEIPAVPDILFIQI